MPATAGLLLWLNVAVGLLLRLNAAVGLLLQFNAAADISYWDRQAKGLS